jgi:leader peptidase (prepilin peptidase)/N-methyltransferase
MIYLVLAGLAGLIIGSFLNVSIYRLPRDLSVARPARSFCPFCKTTIAWYDNIPVISYLLLRGRCRRCNASIAIRYPLVELLAASAFACAVAQHGPTLAAVKLMLFAALLIGLIFTDLEERILPDEMTIGGAIAGIAFAWFVPPPAGLFELFVPSPLAAALDGLSVAGVLWLVGALYRVIRKRDGLGLGDVKMMGMVAIYLGLSGSLLTMILGSLAGSILGLLFIWIRGKDAGTYELPFGSFLGAAALFVAFVGDPLIRLLSGS